MQTLNTDHHPCQISIFFRPMADLNSTDPACNFSTMYFVAEQFSQYNIAHIFTFNEPLYWKSISIKQQQDKLSASKKLC